MAARSLYECTKAHVEGKEIKCRAGHPLVRRGRVWATRLQAGEKLEFAECSNCPDFEDGGDPVPDLDRGWDISQEIPPCY